MPKSKQERLCYYFESKPCEEKHHQYCNGVYEGLDVIEARCSCKCHKEKLSSGSELTNQTTLENFPEVSQYELQFSTS